MNIQVTVYILGRLFKKTESFPGIGVIPGATSKGQAEGRRGSNPCQIVNSIFKARYPTKKLKKII